ncbi:hypothetical protein [Dactylosporangium matsuzakiense]|uniref:Uncharacterized protein n=1 Tax=Dactylosporangium matsuzakiense TaxID=53360 RepID=A0A9W6KJ16_9ACTN|nr:hypothetical protein [Dactylosporangium matsuzakiense]UWZ46749.1 hypothetical protein Dmats_10190 [Dactylosporangium matsuzakiense]GLL01710.1 hypothetical protein GCM10017581_034520 [Dactylosporangium matsuzakiense]
MTGPIDLSAIFDQFGGRCPVCAAALGAQVPIDRQSGRFESPPCLLLEIGPGDGAAGYAWRVSVVGAGFPPARSTVPRFVESEVEYIYVLCGDGHVFPYSAPAFHRFGHERDARRRVDRWNMIAAVGALASGKTYLLIRMLNQELANTQNNFPQHNGRRVERHQLNPLEQFPLDLRSAEYNKTVSELRPMQPTQAEETRPAVLLKIQLPEAVEAIRELIRKTVLDGERRADRWGHGFRQPLVIRTTSSNQITWTGIADLPGELFSSDPGSARERAMLRAFDALIWVIDPAVAAGALDKMARAPISDEADYASVLDGSLRPGTTAVEDTRQVRADRQQDQFEIGRRLTLKDSDYIAAHGRPLEMLIAVTKCDLIRAGLRKDRLSTEGGRRLDALGRPGLVRRGIGAYLASVTRRWRAGEIVPDEHSLRLLSYLYPSAAVQLDVVERRVNQVIDGLLDHYSQEEAFWGLVHEGQRDIVEIPGGGDMALPAQRIEVLSIGEHQDQSTEPGSSERMLIRDLIMSAIGCGVAYGLGHDTALFNLLQQETQRVRFFLCSPLGTVPVSRAEGQPGYAQTYRLEPMNSDDTFPYMGDQSAALTQLLLASLRKARAS